MEFITPIIGLVISVLKIGTYIIIGQAILSWLLAFRVLDTQSPAVRSVAQTLDRITTPLYRPIRKILPDFGGIDFSPIVILLLAWLAINELEVLARMLLNSGAS